MGPRKGTGVRAKGGGAAGKKKQGHSVQSGASTASEDVPQTPRRGPPPPLTPGGAMRGTPMSTRTVFTPVFGRKFARGTIEVPVTPRRVGTPAVARTPYTARRAIADYSEELDPIRTYVRLKPADSGLFAGQLPRSLLQVVSDKELEIAHGDGGERYLFAGVLPTLARQERVYEVCAQPVVADLFNGFNTLLFAYGISNSGKTHTVQGSAASPGLLPRSILTVLDALNGCGAQGDFALRPRYATQVEYCSDPRVSAPTFRSAPGEDAWVAALEAQRTGWAPKEEGNSDEWVYQLYVSYFEVYNEMIYDLLDLSTLTTVQVGATPARRVGGRRTRGRRAVAAAADPNAMSAAQIAALPRTALQLRAEGGEAFVDGVTQVRIRTVRDAVRVLLHGQMRRAVHATGLNAGSSRSHALFQTRLVRVRRDAQIVPLQAVPPEASASVRTMTVVDLAGSERARRTGNAGDRLAEAGKINVGLMTLKKCMDARRFNAANEPQLVPYNESKVTRLFQPALEGGARTAMVVCIDPYEHDAPDTRRLSGAAQALAETRAVLDFARVASELVTRVRRANEPAPIANQEPEPEDEPALEDVSRDEAGSDDEIFFDAPRVPMKRRADVADAAVQTDDTDEGAVPKRQRRDLAGDWQIPPLRIADPVPDVETQPSRNQPMAISPTTPAGEPTTEWEALTRGSSFNFAATAGDNSPLSLSRTMVGGDSASGGHSAMARLRQALAASEAQARQSEREVSELVDYADALEAAVGELRQKYAGAQERAVRIEEETRAEAAEFITTKIGQLQEASSARLRDELALSEAKAAHKLDILSRLRRASGADDDADLSDGEPGVATVSPRTALRRAVSRAASRKANKMASVSAGDDREAANLRTRIESLEAQISSQATQLDMQAQARTADRAVAESMEQTLAAANARNATLEAKLLRLTSVHSHEAELAITRAHEQERAEFLAQITMLKARLRDAEAQSLRARREWETGELLPLQERLRVVLSERQETPAIDDDAAQRLARDRDDAWAWWTREQERNSQLCSQNDMLMREIRHLRARLPPADSARASVHSPSGDERNSEDGDDSDEGFCKVELASINSLEAINGGNPLSTPALDRVISKGRVLHRNPTARGFARDSSDSVVSPPFQRPEGRAKRVVSRVFQNLAPGARRNNERPYMAGRFAHTDTAVGNYAAEVFSFERPGADNEPEPPVRARGNTVDTTDSAESRQAKVRSIVYSGPIVAHATGGVSVTFTSQEVHDLPLGTDPIPEQSEEDDTDAAVAPTGSSPSRPKRLRDVPDSAAMDEDKPESSESDEEPEPRRASSVVIDIDEKPSTELMQIPSMSSLSSTVKKKRKLRAVHTVLDVESPEDVLDNRMVGAPQGASSSRTPVFVSPLANAEQSRTARAADPQASKQPVLFTPVRTRSRGRIAEKEDDLEAQKQDSIFTTPMKMLSRLRHRKK